MGGFDKLVPFPSARRASRARSVLWFGLCLGAGFVGCTGQPDSAKVSKTLQENDNGQSPSEAPIVPIAEFSPAPRPELSDQMLPRAADGSYVLATSGDVELHYNPEPSPSPMTALVRCLDWLMQCYDKTGNRMDDCVAAVPRCTSERPWEEAPPCCPVRCSEQYLAHRDSGNAELAAFGFVFAESLSCVPEYDQWLAGRDP